MVTKSKATSIKIDPEKMMQAMEAAHDKMAKGIHPLKRKDSTLREDYFLLLTAVSGTDNEIDPREINFLKYIASSLGISKMELYFTMCAKVTAARLEKAIRSVKQESAGAYLMLDALILAAYDGSISEKESQFLGLLADCLEIHYIDVSELIKLAVAIISKSPLKLKDYLKGPQPIKPSRIHSLYLKQIGVDEDQHKDSSAASKTKTKSKKTGRK